MKNSDNCIYKVYPFVGIIVGLIFSLIIPLRTVPDETFHVAMAYEVSNRLMGTSSRDGSVMMREDDALKYTQATPYTGEQYREYWKSLSSSLKNDKIINSGVKTIAPFYPYYLSGLGITIGRVLGAGTGITLSLGRLFNLFFFVAMGAFTLRTIPYGRRLMFVLLMMPMSVQQGMSYSYDAFVIALSFFCTAVFLRLNYDERITEKKKKVGIIILATCTLLLFPVKSHAYMLLLFMPIYTCLHFYMPEAKKNTAWKLIRILSLCIVTFIIVCWLIVWRTPGLFKAEPNHIDWANADGYSVTYIMHHPARTVVVLIATLIQLGEYHFVDTLIGCSLSDLHLIIPGTFKVVFLILIFLTALRTDCEEDSLCLRRSNRILFLWTAFLTIIFIAVGMMISWTPLSSPIILGIQGRYYIPVIFMLLILLNNKSIVISDRIQRYVPFAMVVTDIIAVVYICVATP